VRLDRCVKHDLADVARRKQRATARWDQRQARALSQARKNGFMLHG